MEYSWYDLVLLYMVYSFLGWVAETVVAAARGRGFVKRGFAAGPFCYVYGFAAVVMTIGLADLRSSLGYLFLGCALISTLVEWLAAKLLERLHHRTWWDYSNHKFNIDGYVCLPYSLLWGRAGLSCPAVGQRHSGVGLPSAARPADHHSGLGAGHPGRTGPAGQRRHHGPSAHPAGPAESPAGKPVPHPLRPHQQLDGAPHRGRLSSGCPALGPAPNRVWGWQK